MKAKREHRVPLSGRALEILEEARKLHGGGGIVFRGAKGGRIHASMFSKSLRRLGIAGTPHGMRSSFRDWCSETGVAREVAEAALAHKVRSQAEAAYARSDLLDRRRKVMQAWAAYLAGKRRDPVPLSGDRADRSDQRCRSDPLHRGGDDPDHREPRALPGGRGLGRRGEESVRGRERLKSL